MINVTKTYLPPLEEYTRYLEQIWKQGWVTNNGPLVLELEEKLKEYLGVKHLIFCSNGTIALQIAIKAMGLKKEIITTPFSYVATVNSILWENCTPVFVDIDPETFCIDADKIEAAITPNTEAILAVHVYGIPCDVEKIQVIAERHQLKVIYDGAHAFGVKLNGKSIFNYGDVSTCSFHATKLFHTVEGGAIMTNDDALAEKMELHRQFGHRYDNYLTLGVNGKNSEMHAAMGLCNLPRVNELIESRKNAVALYDQLLSNLSLQKPEMPDTLDYNYSYYPCVFRSEAQLLKVMAKLAEVSVAPRRYFYPALNSMPHTKGKKMPVAESVSTCVLCLPLYAEMKTRDIELICESVSLAVQGKRAAAMSKVKVL